LTGCSNATYLAAFLPVENPHNYLSSPLDHEKWSFLLGIWVKEDQALTKKETRSLLLYATGRETIEGRKLSKVWWSMERDWVRGE